MDAVVPLVGLRAGIAGTTGVSARSPGGVDAMCRSIWEKKQG